MIGFPLPIVKPLVPSGILGPFTACLADDASPMMKLLMLLCCGDRESKPRPLWLLVRRCRGLPPLIVAQAVGMAVGPLIALNVSRMKTMETKFVISFNLGIKFKTILKY